MDTRIILCGHKHGCNCYLCYPLRTNPCVYCVFLGSSTPKCCYPYCYRCYPANMKHEGV